jgi:hypothetical protein
MMERTCLIEEEYNMRAEKPKEIPKIEAKTEYLVHIKAQ